MLLMSLKNVSAQFVVSDDAIDLGGNIFQLTPNLQWQSGSVWYQIKHNLNDPFSVEGQMYFGASEAGADGICFVMQQNCLGGGGQGGGIGYENMLGNSLGIEFDTYENSGAAPFDPVYDHIAVHKNGSIDHSSANNLIGPVQMHNTKADVEDGIWYDYAISYDPSSNLLEVYFDSELRISLTVDLINDVFAGDNYVNWGFTSATGGNSADNSVSIFDNPTFALPSISVCEDEEVSVTVTLPPLEVQNIALNKPVVASSNPGPAGNAVDGSMMTTWPSASNDNEWFYVDLEALYNIDSVTINWVPDPNRFGEEYLIQTSTDAATWNTEATIIGGDGGFDKIVFSATNVRYVKMQGQKIAGTGAAYDVFEFRVYSKSDYLWSPDDGSIDDITSATPTFTPTQTTTYTVTFTDPCAGEINYDFTVTFSDEPCEIDSTLLDSSQVIIPNVFTPGNDQKNKYFKPVSVNMQEEHLRIFNRWGHLIFEENAVGTKWDGTKNGKRLPDGAYYFVYYGIGVDEKRYDSSSPSTNNCGGGQGCRGQVILINDK